MLLDTDGPIPAFAAPYGAAFDSGTAHRSLLLYGGGKPSALGHHCSGLYQSADVRE